MQISETVEVVQAAGAGNANTKQAKGWKLLAVTSPATGRAMEKHSSGISWASGPRRPSKNHKNRVRGGPRRWRGRPKR